MSDGRHTATLGRTWLRSPPLASRATALTAAEVPPLPARHRAFSALRHPGFRLYFGCVAITMTADFVEHVISYWVTFQKFHSAALGGFAVVSHWLPFLTL